jgi:hypothetical protein
VEYPTPDSNAQLDSSPSDQDVITEFHLPSHDLLVELVSLFFNHLYHIFPCFHRKTFETQVEDGTMQSESPLVLYAMCCVTARLHPDTSVKQRQKDWYEQAKFSYELTQRNPCPGMRTIQAALLLVVHANTTGDFSSSYLFLGKAWRQAVTLGMNRLDTGSLEFKTLAQQRYGFDQVIKNFKNHDNVTAVEKEELRRTLWLLFIVDRNQAWPTGWPYVISESHFKVDIPSSYSIFKAMGSNSQAILAGNTPFSRKIDRLVTSMSVAREPLNMFHYLSVAHVVLGRVAEVVHSLHDASEAQEYAEDCEELDGYIIKFRLSLPRQATSIVEAFPEDRGHVFWLHIILNNCAVLLHYCCANNVPVRDASSQFPLAVAAARNTAQLVKDASRISIDLLISPHIASSLYVAACVLVIQWRLTNESSLKEDVDLFRLVFDRMNDAFVFLGLKFKLALEHDLERSRENLEDLKNRGFWGLLADCSKWVHVKEEVQRRGIPIDIT